MPNTAPIVTITGGAGTYLLGSSHSVTATATDAEDGTLTNGIVWTSNIQGGTLATGGALNTSGLNIGTHTITATATDSGSLSGTDTCTVIIGDGIPHQISDLGATVISSTEIDLNWSDANSGIYEETGYDLVRATDSGFTQNVVTVHPNADTTSYSVTGLIGNITYYFKLRATNANGNGAYSSTQNATTDLAAPTAPSNLSARSTGDTSIGIHWADNSGTATGDEEAQFDLDTADDAAFTVNKVTTHPAADATSASLTGLTLGDTKYFRIRATNSAGSSTYSNTAHATAGAPTGSSLRCRPLPGSLRNRRPMARLGA
jgi:titin